MKTVTVISKDECSLCDKAIDTLELIRKEKPFNLHITKITPGSTEYEEYKEKIPVILIDGKEVFHFRVNERKFKKLL